MIHSDIAKFIRETSIQAAFYLLKKNRERKKMLFYLNNALFDSIKKKNHLQHGRNRETFFWQRKYLFTSYEKNIPRRSKRMKKNHAFGSFDVSNGFEHFQNYIFPTVWKRK